MRNSLTYMAAVLAAMPMMTACGGDSQDNKVAKEERALVRVDTIKTTNVDRKIEYTANLEANEQDTWRWATT